LKILVTGGAGFIGKHLVKLLIKKGNEVTIFDNFSNSSKESILHLIEIGAKCIEGDIRNESEIFDATKNKNIIIHLAAKISVEESFKNPSDTFETNVDGTKNVLIACKKNSIKKMIVASSAAIYGESVSQIQLNEEAETNPISPYGKSKLIMEKEINEFTSKYKINCVILRFFNIYGIGQSNEYAGVISKFINNLQNNLSLIIYGNGNQTRDFVAIGDIINLIFQICNLKFEKTNSYNIGNSKAISIIELAKLMIHISKKDIKIICKEKKKGDILHSVAKIDKAKEKLNYEPKITLKQGIEEFLFHQNNI